MRIYLLFILCSIGLSACSSSDQIGVFNNPNTPNSTTAQNPDDNNDDNNDGNNGANPNSPDDSSTGTTPPDNSTGNNPNSPPENSTPSTPANACKGVEYPSQQWTQCEAQNFAKVGEAPAQQTADADFNSRLAEQSAANFQEYQTRPLSDPHWQSDGNVCATWGQNCVGDPFRYPGSDSWYDEIGDVTPINFYDAEGARLNGRVWAPKNPPTGKTYPAIVIINGSVQAPETLYWWAVQLLVSNGYLVMTFDPRGQGRSDNQTPDGQQGSNANSVVFRRNLIDAIEFFYSTPNQPYVHNLPNTPGHTSDNGLAATTAFNPIHALFDRDRLGIAGHSLGATGVSVVQGEEDWAGTMLTENPVKAMVAWDNLMLASSLDGIDVTPRVPSMGQAGDYFLSPTPYQAPPDAEEKTQGFNLWRDAGVPSMQVNIAGASHYEWSLLPQFPTSAWEPGKILAADGSEAGTGWAQPVAQYYTLAWFDRWLKLPDETGYDTADARLLNDDLWRDRLSWHFLSKRAYPLRDGVTVACEDIAAGC